MFLKFIKYSKDPKYLRARKIKSRRSKMGFNLQHECIIKRTNNHIEVNIFDHKQNKTLSCISSKSFRFQSKKEGKPLTRSECAKIVGQKLKSFCDKEKIKKVSWNVAELRYQGSARLLVESFNS